ncbi:hypothetical protein ABTE76_18925, partial [Acinetobacter baumannii]
HCRLTTPGEGSSKLVRKNQSEAISNQKNLHAKKLELFARTKNISRSLKMDRSKIAKKRGR